MIILLKLILAHLIADFLLQPNNWVLAKRKYFLNSWHLYVHAALHGIISWIFIAEWNFWSWALIISVTHWIIDTLKIILQRRYEKFDLFFLDQIAHFITIGFIWLAITKVNISLYWLNDPETWLTLTCLFLLTYPTSVVISHLMQGWTKEIKKSLRTSLKNSGKYIGILERLLIFGFIYYNQWAAIGLLITAKSVYRFGDLTNAKERKLTEYILLGSLLSLLIAVVISIGYINFMKINNLIILP